MLQAVNDCDECVDLDRLTVEDGRVVAPLAYGVEGGLQKEGVAADNLQGLNRAVSGDERAQFHTPFAVNLYRERRINGLDALDQQGLFNVGDMKSLRRLGSYFRGTFRLMPVVV